MLWWNAPGTLGERVHYLMVDTTDGYNVATKLLIQTFLTVIGIDTLMTQSVAANVFIAVGILALVTVFFSWMDTSASAHVITGARSGGYENPAHRTEYVHGGVPGMPTPPPPPGMPVPRVPPMPDPRTLGIRAGLGSAPHDPFHNPVMYGGASDDVGGLYFRGLADPTLCARPVYWSQPTRPDVVDDRLAYAGR